MSLFTIADLHLSLGTDKPMDVFGGKWTNYVEKLDEYWRYMVSDSDTVVIPGDISWAMNIEDAVNDFRFIEALPGKKIIMKGNHDYWWMTAKKLGDFVENNGFKTISFLHNNAYEVEGKLICGSRGWMCEDSMTAADVKVLEREALRFKMSIDAARSLDPEGKKEIIVFSHYPIATYACRGSAVLDLLEKEGIKRAYYGHLHGVNESQLIKNDRGIKFELVASDHLMFTPMRIE